jgi:hypothetical protein
VSAFRLGSDVRFLRVAHAELLIVAPWSVAMALTSQWSYYT